jgi:hypothetical protein
MAQYFGGATADGMAYGQSDKADLTGLMAYTNARTEIEGFATKHLGQQKTGEMLKTFNDDYIKSFVSGVIESNPEKGVKLLDDPTIKGSMPADQYLKFRGSAEARARAVYKNQEQGGVLRTLKNSSDALANGGNYSYADLQDKDLTPEAKKYFESLNGYNGTGKRGGFTAEDKAAYQMAIFDSVQKLSVDKDMDAASVRLVQDNIYRGMNKGAITQAQGQEYLAQIVNPLIGRKEEAMQKFGEYNWFDDDVGFGGIQDYYEKNVQRPEDKMNGRKLSKDEQLSSKNANLVNKANLYDYYMGALSARASAAGVPVADVPRLPKVQREKIYGQAQTEAQIAFVKDKHPALRTMPDVPNFVYSNGQLIQGATGPRNVKPSATANATFKLKKDPATGDIYRVFENGQKELARKGGQ